MSVINYSHSVNYFDIDKYLDFDLLKGQFHEMNIVLRDIHFYSYNLYTCMHYAMMVFKCVTKLLPCFRKVYGCLPTVYCFYVATEGSTFAGRLWRFRRVYA